MKKLLHERLREWAHDSIEKDQYPSILATEELFGFYYDPKEEERKLFGLMADEIQRYYIPRPRYEDGEPIVLGMNVTGIQIRFDIEGREIGTELTGLVLEIRHDAWHGAFLEIELENGDEALIAGYEGSNIFKRPSPKVLDADGVEIKKGDMLWDEEGEKFEVADVDNGYPLPVKLTQDGEFIGWNSGKYLTHKEPDSLEKLRDEIANFDDLGYQYRPQLHKKWADRLSALIERVD